METFDEAHHQIDPTPILDFVRQLTGPVISLAPTTSYVQEQQLLGRVVRTNEFPESVDLTQAFPVTGQEVPQHLTIGEVLGLPRQEGDA